MKVDDFELWKPIEFVCEIIIFLCSKMKSIYHPALGPPECYVTFNKSSCSVCLWEDMSEKMASRNTADKSGIHLWKKLKAGI